jgi:Big-like domain-containing protein
MHRPMADCYQKSKRGVFMKYSWMVTLVLTVCLAGCGSSGQETIAGTPTVSAAELTVSALDDSFFTLADTRLTVDAEDGLLENDQTNGAQVSSGIVATDQGGTAELAPDGGMIYSPPNGFIGQDSFVYSLDGGTSDTQAEVVITVRGVDFYVDNQAEAGGDGSIENPFNTLSGAVDAAQADQTIFIYKGDGTDSGLGPVQLKPGLILVGETNSLSFQTSDPQVGPVLAVPIGLADGVELRGIQVGGDPNAEVPAVTGSQLSDVVFSNTIIKGSFLGFTEISLDGTLTIKDSALELTNLIADNTSVVQLNSRETRYSGCRLVARDKSDLTFISNDDRSGLSTGSADEATMDLKFFGFVGRMVFELNGTGFKRINFLNSQLELLNIDLRGPAIYQLDVTGGEVQSLSCKNSSAGAQTFFRIQQVSQTAGGVIWILTGFPNSTSKWVLDRCVSRHIRVKGDGGKACFSSRGGEFSLATFMDVTVERLNEFRTDNSFESLPVLENVRGGPCDI